MVYAPIVIPTLNRKEHLARCIESLNSNQWAKYTEVYISVDFPPNDKYVEGYHQVKDYLSELETNFKGLEVVYQENNLGPVDNWHFIVDYVGAEYDRYIFLEDDVEVSPNFIQYMDECLERFKNDENVLAVCACGEYNEDVFEYNVAYGYNLSAWGIGRWFDKDKEIKKNLRREYFVKKAKSFSRLCELYNMDPGLFLSLQSLIRRKERIYWEYQDELPSYDQLLKILIVFEKKVAVFPTLVKSRNWGFDGSGVNCNLDEESKSYRVEMDSSHQFELRVSNPPSVVHVRRKKRIEDLVRFLVGVIKISWWRIVDGT